MTQTSDDAQQQRLEDLHQRLHDQVLTLADSDSWKAWLDTAKSFHRYSFNNTVAIWMQRPDATQVAGYPDWQDLGRQVRKGERASKCWHRWCAEPKQGTTTARAQTATMTPETAARWSATASRTSSTSPRPTATRYQSARPPPC